MGDGKQAKRKRPLTASLRPAFAKASAGPGASPPKLRSSEGGSAPSLLSGRRPAYRVDARSASGERVGVRGQQHLSLSQLSRERSSTAGASARHGNLAL